MHTDQTINGYIGYLFLVIYGNDPLFTNETFQVQNTASPLYKYSRVTVKNRNLAG